MLTASVNGTFVTVALLPGCLHIQYLLEKLNLQVLKQITGSIEESRALQLKIEGNEPSLQCYES